MCTKQQRERNHRNIKRVKRELLQFIYARKNNSDNKFKYKLDCDLPDEYKRRLTDNMKYVNIKCVFVDNYIEMEILPERRGYHLDSHFRLYRKEIIQQYLTKRNDVFINKRHLKKAQISRLKRYLKNFDIDFELVQERYGYFLVFR